MADGPIVHAGAKKLKIKAKPFPHPDAEMA
jgi:hypothetical protein